MYRKEGQAVTESPFFSNGIATLYRADAREIPLPDASVHCVVTSPPYFGLRNYELLGWSGGAKDCEHLPRPRDTHAETSTMTGGRPSNSNHMKEGWPGGVCGRCGAKQVVAGIGQEATLQDYIDGIVSAFREIWRVLRPDGTVWLNMGDSYSGSWGNFGARSGKQRTRRKERYPRSAYDDPEHGFTGKPPTASMDLAPKNLIGVPWRVAFALQSDGAADAKAMRVISDVVDTIWREYDGETPPDRVLAVLERLHGEYAQAKGNSWWLRRDIIWHKPNTTPESVKDRPVGAHEYIFLLAKAERYLYDHIAVRTPAKGPYNNTIESRRARATTIKSLPDALHNGIRPPTGNKKRKGHERKQEGWLDAGTKEEQQAMGASLRDVWTMPPASYKGPHYAAFPEELPRKCILAGTSERGVCGECGAPWTRVVQTHTENPGNRTPNGPKSKDNDLSHGYAVRRESVHTTVGWKPTCDHDADVVPATVLDPFVGTGTTVAVAQQLGRRGIGIDLSERYLKLAVKRITAVPLPMLLGGKDTP